MNPNREEESEEAEKLEDYLSLENCNPLMEKLGKSMMLNLKKGMENIK